MNRGPHLFAEELSWITDVTIKEFTEFCLESAPDYFWEVPSASTGKHHPSWANGHGGLVRHTKATAYIAKELTRAYDLNETETAAAISAALLHDIAKYGLPGGKYTVNDHDRVGANYIVLLAKKFGKSVPMLKELCSAIALHYGVWTKRPEGIAIKKFPEEYTRIEQLVHVADMVTSRKEVRFTFLEANLVG